MADQLNTSEICGKDGRPRDEMCRVTCADSCPFNRPKTTDCDFHFHLVCWEDESVEGTLDLDEHQIWIEPNRKKITISLSGAQLQRLAEWPSARARTKS